MDAIVPALARTVANTLGALAAGEFSLLWGLEGEIRKLRDHLEVIVPVIRGVEEVAATSEAVSAWLRSLKRVAYDAGDAFDELRMEAALRPGLMSQADARVGTHLKKLVSACFLSGFTAIPNPCLFRHRMAARINDITTRFDEAVMRLGLLNPAIVTGRTAKAIDGGSLPEPSRMRETASVQDVRVPLLGREEFKEEILNQMLGTPADKVRVSVVAVVGMGGVGKTTLAQHIYNDDQVQKHFPVRKWLFVGENFDGRKLIGEIVGEGNNKLSKDELCQRLKNKIKDDRFLCVLDDVWSDKRHEWDELLKHLAHGTKGGKILVTTRSRNVANTMGSGVFLRELQPFAYQECLSIFERCAFGDLNPASFPELRKIGKKIVNKVGGNPLAARAVGGFLSRTLRKDKWENTLHSKIWPQVLAENDILPILKLSYQNLPSHLKQCFAYCAIFPKGFRLDREGLVLMWMAQGYIESRGDKEMEDVGGEYFEELLDRSFFQHIDYNYVMHDLMHDLAEWVSKGECLRIEIAGEAPSCGTPEDVYHISLCCPYATPIDPERLYKFNRARTLVRLRGNFSGTPDRPLCQLFSRLKCISFQDSVGVLSHCTSDSIHLRCKPDLSQLFSRLNHIRVLNLRGWGRLQFLPYCIGDLKHLHYLDLVGAWEESEHSLPESLCKLYNLQTLRLDDDCKLPKGMSKLVNLRHLEADDDQISEISGLGKLTCLQKLWPFNVSKGRIRELNGMNQLRELGLYELEKAGSVEEAAQARLKDKVLLRELELVWSGDSDDQGVILDTLQPPPNLEELSIYRNNGTHPPRWMSMMTLVDLKLYGFKGWARLPPLGQLPSLKSLEIWAMPKVKQVGAEFFFIDSHRGRGADDGRASSRNVNITNQGDVVMAFPTLEVLRFVYMDGWESWCVEEGGVEVGVEEYQEACGCRLFPRLRELGLLCCPLLSSVSPLLCHRLQALKTTTGLTLKLVQCLNLQTTYPSTFPLPTEVRIESRELLSRLLGQPSNILESITRLDILPCDDLTGFTEEEEEVWRCNLPFLKSLDIRGCCRLLSLPAGLHNLPSLKVMEIYDCENIQALPEKGLPPALQKLVIHRCPQLTKRCMKEPGGPDWPKIAHILHIEIDGQEVQDISSSGHPSGA